MTELDSYETALGRHDILLYTMFALALIFVKIFLVKGYTNYRAGKRRERHREGEI